MLDVDEPRVLLKLARLILAVSAALCVTWQTIYQLDFSLVASLNIFLFSLVENSLKTGKKAVQLAEY